MSHERQAATEWMILDTGAEMTLIPWSTGRVLGFERGRREAARWMGGIGGRVGYVERRLTLGWDGGELTGRVAWAQTDGLPALLGRSDFLDRLDVAFYGPARRFTIRRP